VHHILAEVVQGGLVLETNVDEISSAGECREHILSAGTEEGGVQEKAKARKLSHGVGNGLASLGGPTMQTPLGWLTERITGVSAR